MYCYKCGNEREVVLDVACLTCGKTPVEIVPIKQWVILALVSLIPVVNLIVLLYWTITHANESFRNFLKAYWVIYAISFVVNITFNVGLALFNMT